MPLNDIVVVEVVERGRQGVSGEEGDPGPPGPSNLVVSQTNPGLTEPGLWIELHPDNTVKTFWVEDGV